MAKTKSKAAYMISSVAEQYEIHPQTLRLYEREGLLTPSRSDGNTRLYTDEDLERLEVILKLTRDLGVNLARTIAAFSPISTFLMTSQAMFAFQCGRLGHTVKLSFGRPTAPAGKLDDSGPSPTLRCGLLV